jgi:hypothetical protein
VPLAPCQAPFRLALLPNGVLALIDKTNMTMWSSASACAGNSQPGRPSCYSLSLSDIGMLMVKDSAGTATWTSTGSNKLGSGAKPSVVQLLSGGVLQASCIAAPEYGGGDKQPATALVSSSGGTYSVAVKGSTAKLSNAGGTVMWSATAAPLPRSPRYFCLRRDGALALSNSYSFATSLGPQNSMELWVGVQQHRSCLLLSVSPSDGLATCHTCMGS